MSDANGPLTKREGDIDVADLAERIQRRVHQKVSNGFYTDKEIKRVRAARMVELEPDAGQSLISSAISGALPPLRERWDVTQPVNIVASGGGLKGALKSLYKLAFSKLIQPTMNISLSRQAEFNSQVIHSLERIEEGAGLQTRNMLLRQHGLNQRMTRVETVTDEFSDRLDSVEEVNAALRESTEKLAANLSDLDKQGIFLRRRITKMLDEIRLAAEGEVLKTAEAEAQKLSGYDYVLFENMHRGSRSEIKERLAIYADWFAGAENVLDIGCGRGELLELFNEKGIGATGVDLNEDMVEECHHLGLNVECDDAITALRTRDDGSLGGVSAIQLIEHLPTEVIADFFRLCYDKLRSGGVVAAETINPTCLTTLSGPFYLDMTHEKPVHPLAVQFLLERIGFSEVRIEYLNPYPADIRLLPFPYTESLGELEASFMVEYNRNVEKLNNVLFTHGDYAVVAKK